MGKKILFLILSCFLLATGQIYSQVGINTETPNQLTELEIINLLNDDGEVIPKGIMIPRMTEEERDKMDVTTNKTTSNSVLIYNTDEDCYNYYSRLNEEWQSLCGKLGKAQFTMDCSSIKVSGKYLNDVALNTSNYITVTVNVTKPGSYTITALPDPENGYYFIDSGEFLATGEYSLILKGMGTPNTYTKKDEPGDLVKFYLQGVESECTTYIKIEDSSIKPEYTMDCRMTKANGIYIQNKKLDPLKHTITLYINVAATATGATYDISTNTVDGMRFSATGILVAGRQLVTLLPDADSSPTSAGEKTFTITSNSSSSSATCVVNLDVAYPARTIVTISDYWGTWCYGPGGSGNYAKGHAQSTKLMKTATNFGTLPNSIVKVEAINIKAYDTALTGNATKLQSIIDTDNPSIIQYSVRFRPNQAQCNILKKFVEDGGVLIAQSDDADAGGPSGAMLLNTIFGTTSITNSRINRSGALYQMPTTNDEIMNGPFGDVRGKYWGEDASVSIRMTGLPADDVIQYSSDEDWSAATQKWGGYTMLRHKTLGLFWIGDGGFLSGDPGTNNILCPFKIDENNKNLPVPKQNYGHSSKQPVYNSIIFANIMAWAIKSVQNN
ncbi:hypothetical protein LJC00_00770 [Dysgonomonas sp. OttesenSCG-928-M03]|nr:hypothetical protein [Dysgonomonas sp. OttesenSCG-928-M03]